MIIQMILNYPSSYLTVSYQRIRGRDTRLYFLNRATENIFKEIQSFFEIHKSEGSVAGGVHLELTGLDVTECVGGPYDIKDENLGDRYHTFCDPRLNVNQSLELSFLLADLLSNGEMNQFSYS